MKMIALEDREMAACVVEHKRYTKEIKNIYAIPIQTRTFKRQRSQLAHQSVTRRNRNGRGACYEREKQRGKGKQEGATKKPQRKEKDEEGEEEQVSWKMSMIR